MSTTLQSSPVVLAKFDFLIDLLLEMGLVRQPQLDGTRELVKHTKMGVVQQMVQNCIITHEELAQAMAEQYDCEIVDLKKIEIPSAVISLVPSALAWKYQVIPVEVIPIEQKDDSLILAVEDPSDLETFEFVTLLLKLENSPVLKVATGPDIRMALWKYYPNPPMPEAE